MGPSSEISFRSTRRSLEAARARAVLAGREYVVPDDVQAEARAVMTHRVRTDSDRPAAEIVTDALDSVPVE